MREIHHHQGTVVRITLSISLLIILLSAAIAADDFRNWTDSTGKFTVDAKFVQLNGVKVVLEKRDGSRIQIDLHKLKQSDRITAMDQESKRGREDAKKWTEQAMKDMESKGFPMMGNSAFKPGSRKELPTTSPVDWSQVKKINITNGQWKAPAITAVESQAPLRARAVTIKNQRLPDRATGVAIASQANVGVCIVATDNIFTSPMSTDSNVHVCQLQTGAILHSFSIPGSHTPLALSPDGTQLVTRENVAMQQSSQVLCLFDIARNELTPQRRWTTGSTTTARDAQVQWATFVDEDSLLTWQTNGELTWWNVGQGRPLQNIRLQASCVPALSLDRKYVAGKLDQRLVLFDARTGEPYGVKDLPTTQHYQLAFSPDGKQLAATAEGKVEIYELEQAALVKEIAFEGAIHESPCFWTGPHHLLAGAPLCYLDTRDGYNVWAYLGADRAVGQGGTAFSVVSSPQTMTTTLMPMRLPHQAAIDIVAQSQRDPDFFLLKPGKAVQLDASGIGDPQLRQQVIQLLTAKVAQAGQVVGPSAATYVASVEREKDDVVTYHSANMPAQAGKKHQVAKWTYRLNLVTQGKTCWQKIQTTTPPSSVLLRNNETIESHLAPFGTPNAEFFQKLLLPRHVVRTPGEGFTGGLSWRASRVTPESLR